MIKFSSSILIITIIIIQIVLIGETKIENVMDNNLNDFFFHLFQINVHLFISSYLYIQINKYIYIYIILYINMV